MSGNQWLLVEWVEKESVFPNYGVVNVNALLNEETDLHPGKMVFVRDNQGTSAKQAQILRIDSKQKVKEHKALLERQSHQLKNMLTLCMQTIKEIKTDPLGSGGQHSSNRGSSSTKVMSQKHESSSEGDDEIINNEQNGERKVHNLYANISTIKAPVQNPPTLPINGHGQPKLRPVGSSTPLLVSKGPKEVVKTMTDQACQTDDSLVSVTAEDFQEIETVLTHLYKRYLTLVESLRLKYQEMLSDSEEEVSAGQNDVKKLSLPRERLTQLKLEAEETKHDAESILMKTSARTSNVVMAEPSSQSHRNEMVSLGSGNVIVPARLMNEINWNSYSSATRHLLQAVFPRKILATHSLTGKKSPAFANKPAKKCLDPKMIDDIVNTVSERCGVPKRSVRNCITIKCTDEAKLYRNRIQGRSQKHATTTQGDQENVPPSPMTMNDSSNGTD